MATADGEKATYALVDADGKQIRGESTYTFDGKEAPVAGLPDSDTFAFKRAGPLSLAVTVKKDGRVARTATREVSPDGKTLTVTSKGTNAKGQPLDETAVFDRVGIFTDQDRVVAAVKAAVAKHWAAINRPEGADMPTITGQHTYDMTMFGSDWAHLVALNSPLGLSTLKLWDGSKSNWTLRNVQVQPLGSSTAVATFTMEGWQRRADGSVDSRPRRVTEVWVNENGTWKEAHHHDSVYAANPR